MQPDFNTLIPVATSQPDFNTLQPAGQTQTQPKSLSDSIWNGLVGATSGVANFVTGGTGPDIAAAADASHEQANVNQMATQRNANLQAAVKSRNQLKAAGKDTSKSDKLIADMIAETHSASDVLPSLNKSNEQVAGDFVQLGGNVLSAGSLPGVGADIAGAKTIGQGVLAGAKAGAISGGIFGTASGAGSAMQNNESGVDVAKSAAIGGGTGAALGAGFGAVGGGISGAINKAKAPATLEDALKITSPSLNKKASIASLEKAGLPGGPNEPTMTGVSSNATQKDVQIANSVKDMVSTNKSPEGNIININRNIAEKSNKVASVLEKDPVPFNFEDFRDFMTQQVSPDATLKNSPGAEATYARVRENLLSTVYNELKANATKTGDFGSITDMGELWNSRMSVDNRIENELGNTVFESPQYTGVKAAATDFRNAFNQFIGENFANPGEMGKVNVMHNVLQGAREKGIAIPTEDAALDVLRNQLGITTSSKDAATKAAIFQDSLTDLSNMYQARRNIAESSYRLLGKNLFTRTIANHPVAAKVSKALLAGLGIGLAGELGMKAVE